MSGGLDSSAILAVAECLRRKGQLLAPSLDGYTLAFSDDSDANEMDYARAVGEHLGIPVHEVVPTHKPLEWYRDRAQRLRTFPSYPNGVMGIGIRDSAMSRGSRALLVRRGRRRVALREPRLLRRRTRNARVDGARELHAGRSAGLRREA